MVYCLEHTQKAYKKAFKEDYRKAKEFLISRFGGEIKWSENDYEVFRYITKDVVIIFYPYQSSSRYHSLRIRYGGGKNKIRAQAIMDVIGIDCGFHQKNHWPSFHYNDEQKEEIRRIAKGE